MLTISWDYDEAANPSLVHYLVRAWYPGGDPELAFDETQTVAKGTKTASFAIAQHATKDRGIYYTVTVVNSLGQATVSATFETVVPKTSVPLPAVTSASATYTP